MACSRIEPLTMVERRRAGPFDPAWLCSLDCFLCREQRSSIYNNSTPLIFLLTFHMPIYLFAKLLLTLT